MKNYSYRGVCGVTSDNMIECPVLVDGNVVTLKFPVDNCKEKKGRDMIMNEVRKRAGLEPEIEKDACEEEEGGSGLNEQQQGEKKKEKESVKRYNTRGVRIDYEEFMRFGVRRVIEGEEEFSEDSLDTIPIFMGLFKSVYDLYLVCYPRRTKYYTPFSREELLKACENNNIALIPLVAPTSKERINKITTCIKNLKFGSLREHSSYTEETLSRQLTHIVWKW